MSELHPSPASPARGGREHGEAAAVVYAEYHPRWYRKRVSIYWWLEKWSSFRFILREISSVFVAFFVVMTLLQIRALGQGPEAYANFQGSLQSPVLLALHVLSFFFVLFHTITWFNLDAPGDGGVHSRQANSGFLCGRAELRGLDCHFRRSGLVASARINAKKTAGTVPLEPVQRRWRGSRLVDPSPSAPVWHCVSAGLAGTAELPESAGFGRTSLGANLSVRPLFASAFPLGSPFPVHALRWVADQTPERNHQPPLLWRRNYGNNSRRLFPVEHPLGAARKAGARSHNSGGHPLHRFFLIGAHRGTQTETNPQERHPGGNLQD